MSYEMVGENRVSLSHIDCTSGLEAIRPQCHDKLYVRHNTIRPLYGFSGRISFSLYYPPIL
jgi:hypothetical protein